MHVCREDGVDLGGNEGGEQDQLSDISSIVVQVPCSNATEVAAMSFLRLKIEVLQNVGNMVPVLHK